MSSIAQYLFDKWNGVDRSAETKAELLRSLQSGIWKVTFTKVDGSESVMEVTLDPQFIPTKHTLKESSGRPEQPHLVSAFSPDRDGWRSFTVANVKSFVNIKDGMPVQPLLHPGWMVSRIDATIAEQLGVDISQVHPDKDFIHDLGADSLDGVELIMAIEDEFGIEIDDEAAANLRTVKDVYDYVARNVKP